MGTKNKPGDYDCYANADPDEPMFVLLGRDDRSPALVEQWAAMSEARGTSAAKVEEARACATAMRAWRKDRTGFERCPLSSVFVEDHSFEMFGDLDGKALVVLHFHSTPPLVEVESTCDDDGGALFANPAKLRGLAAALAEAAERLDAAKRLAK